MEVKPNDSQEDVVAASVRGRLIRRRREQIGLSIRQFAELVKVTEATVRNWESGRTKPERYQIMRMRRERVVSDKDRKSLNALLKSMDYELVGDAIEDYSSASTNIAPQYTGLDVREQSSSTSGDGPTDLLKEVVVPYLDDLEVKYAPSGRYITLDISLPSEGIRCHIIVKDVSVQDFPLIGLHFTQIVRFEEGKTTDALTLCNELNNRTAGKFMLDSDGDIQFTWDVTIPHDLDPDGFKLAFELALYSVSYFYKPIMLVRWAGVTIQDALGEMGHSQSSKGSVAHPDERNSDEQSE